MHEWFEYVWDGRFAPGLPIVTTLHVSGLHSGIEEFRARNPAAPNVPSMHSVAISEYQRRQYANLIPVEKNIPHGLDTKEYPYKIGRAHVRTPSLMSITYAVICLKKKKTTQNNTQLEEEDTN